MTPEQALDHKIMVWCGEHNYLCWHINVGGGYLPNGSYFRTGLPKGASDLWIITDKGKLILCETKIHPRKPTSEQLHFIDIMRSRGVNAFVAYSLDEFIANVL